MKFISKLPYYLTSLAILGILAACDTMTPVTVNTSADPTATFGKYHTYALDSAAIGLSATGSAALQSALRSSLAAKGLKESGNNSDLYIVPTVYTQQKLNVMPGGGYTVFPSAYGSYRMGTVALNAGVQTYSEGTLVIDFVDRRTHTVVYRGSGQAAVGSAERNANAITEAVNKIVANYP
jgi:surface antigen